MEDTYVQSFDGAPEPPDVFEPHMPGVDLFTDMDARFRTVRDTLAKGTSSSAEVTSGRALPNLAGLTNDPQALDWIGGLPFRYDRLDADKVIAVILRVAGWRWYHFFKKTGVLS